MKKKRIILGVIVLVVVLIIAGRMLSFRKGVETVPVEEGVTVKVMETVKKDIRETISLTGDIKARERIEVYPRVSGKIIKKNVVEGDRIKKGQTIVLIDRDEPGFKFEPAPVDSPLAGIVGRVYVDLGTKVTPQTPIALIVDIDRVKVKIDVVEKDLPKIKIGQEVRVRVDAYPDKVFTGKAWKISPIVDPISRKAWVETLIPNPKHLLKPGMFARVEIIIKTHKDTLLLPHKALLKQNGQKIVFVVQDSRALLKRVETGLSDEESIEIVKGLAEGEIVIIEGNYGLSDNTLVIIQN